MTSQGLSSRAKPRWSEDKIQRLRVLRGAGKTVPEIATALGMPVEAVYAKAKRLVRSGALDAAKAPKWTHDQIALLADLSISSAEVAGRIGRTLAAVRVKRVKLGFTDREFWSAPEDEALISMRADGKSFAEIAAALDRSESAISNHVNTLIKSGRVIALPTSERSKRGAQAWADSRPDRWNQAEQSELARLWKDGMTAEEISAVSQARSKSAINNELSNLRRSGYLERLQPSEIGVRVCRATRVQRDRRYAKALEIVQSLPGSKSAGYVVGVLYGDGFISTQGNRGSIGLKTTNQSFCNAFSDALAEVFNRRPRDLSRVEPLKIIGNYRYENVRYFETFLHSIHLGRALLDVFGPTDTFNWRCDPEFLMEKGVDFSDGVIQGFFDSEGSFLQDSQGRCSATACSMNGHGIGTIHALLLARRYPATLTDDARGQWRTRIFKQDHVARFAREIGSRIDYKAKAMTDFLAKRDTGPQFVFD